MADRFFPNNMPDFVSEEEEEEETSPTPSAKDLLFNLLRLPYNTFSQRLTVSALAIKDTVVKETCLLDGKRVKDYTLYTGALGTAYLAFRAYQLTHNQNDLKLCLQIVKSCDSASKNSGRATFICGRAGVCALGAILAKHAGDERLLNYYLKEFNEVRLPSDIPNELLYGQAGFLWTCLFLNKHIGNGTIAANTMRAVADETVKSGRQLAKKGRCPLMYEWHGKRYWGAAHGLAGIMHVLMYEWHGKRYWGAAHGLAGIMHVLMHLELKPDEVEDVKGTLRYMIKHRFPSGNYPSSEGSESDRLVHWCHGAPGVALTLAKAAEVFKDEEFLQAAVDAGEVVWKPGLLKRVGICHGISGNAYVFLSLYRLTGDARYLYRAKVFASFLFDRAQKLISEGKMHGGDRPYSMFEGIGGMAHLFLDMVDPSEAKFPAYQL